VSLNFRTLDLNLLRVLDTVMAEGSLTRAAGTLAMTQPAVSHAMRRLREVVGEDLFVRTAHGMKPTPLAETLWPQVREALATLRNALAPGDFNPQRDAVQLRVTMADSQAALLAPNLVEAIEREQALTSIRILPLTTRDPRKLLEAGEAELAVGYFPEAVTSIVTLGPDSLLRQARLYDSRYVCVMRQGHPLADRELTLDDYCAAHHLLVSTSGRPHGQIDFALSALGRTRRIVLTVNQFFTGGRVVARSNLLSALPEGFVPVAGAGLVMKELPVQLAPVNVQMLWHLRHDADPAHRWLRQQVLAAAAAGY
jgi:DNA-binding transcriptional LysR family regulator